ncbi:MAG TPA: 50S ribosomal protein L4 [Chthonomonadales bacterium]|nr:50S ribosomal protein L4 [Chthonomonadales bacterium]
MPEIPLFNASGREIGTVSLNDSVFGVPFNETLVHQAVTTEEANRRQGTADTKERGEIRGGGRKPWRQKGTGRARQGTTRAPHWRHGGVVGGPTPRSSRKALPVKMRRGAMRSVLSGKVSEGAVVALDDLGFTSHKTRQTRDLLKALSLGDTRRVLIVIPDYSLQALLSTRNLQGVELRHAPNFSVRDAILAHRIVLLRDAVQKIETAFGPQTEAATEAAEAVQ